MGRKKSKSNTQGNLNKYNRHSGESVSSMVATSRICVKNLPKYVDEKRLRDIFGGHGGITDLKVIKTRSGMSRRLAFVGFRTIEEARDALKYFNNTYVDTSRISVEFAQPRGTSAIQRPWSRYSQGSSAFVETHGAPPRITKVDRTESARLLSLTEEKLKLVENDPQFVEFLAVMKSRNSSDAHFWANDDTSTIPGFERLRERLAKKALSATNAEENTEEAPVAPNDDLVASSDDDDDDDDDDGDVKTTEGSKLQSNDLDFLRQKSLQFNDTGGRDGEEDIEEDVAMEDAEKEDDDEKSDSNDDDGDDDNDDDGVQEDAQVRQNSRNVDPCRLFVRNLPYSVVEEDIQNLFSPFGTILELHVPVNRSNRAKGFAFVTYGRAEDAQSALNELDKTVQLGRLIHLIPGFEKPPDDVTKLKELPDDVRNAMTYKKKREILKRASAGMSESWNALFVRSETVVDAVADKYGVSKEEILDRTADNTAVRLALAETQLINETKEYLLEHGVDMSAFSGDRRECERSDTVILVKNIPFETTIQDVTKTFARFGNLGRVIVPPSKTMAIVEFVHANEAKQAFRRLAYTKFMRVPLYLEWAPKQVLMERQSTSTNEHTSAAVTSSIDEFDRESMGTTLFVKNLNFESKHATLKEVFDGVRGFRSVTIATRPNPNYEPGVKNPKHREGHKEVLSRGYAFVEYDTPQHARIATEQLNGVTVDGHKLEITVSTRATEHTEDATQVSVTPTTKLVVKNVPFEATSREVRNLFSTFGQVKSCRLPRKFDGGHRGFAFVDFVTKEEAKSAFAALKHTHLYGRHLVVNYAEEDDTVEQIREKTTRDYLASVDAPRPKRTKLNSD